MAIITWGYYSSTYLNFPVAALLHRSRKYFQAKNVDCLFPSTWRNNTNEKKRYGWSVDKSFSCSPCSAKMASASSIARDRSLQSTYGKYKRQGNSDTVKVPLHERVRKCPDENFIVWEAKLFCNACRQILSTKKSDLKIHVLPIKHQDGKQKM